MMDKIILPFLLIPLAAGLVLLILYINPRHILSQRVTHPLHTGFYVWQKVWTPSVESALSRSQPSASGYWLFAGSVDSSWTGLETHIDLSKPVIQSLSQPITPVYRIHHSRQEWLSKANFEETYQRLIQPMLTLARQAKQAGLPIAGIQIDYDCATSKLRDYAEWLSQLKSAMEEFELSVTALPTWMSSRFFAPLVRSTDYYVLQIHSFEPPAAGNVIQPIFDDRRYPDYVKRAQQTGHPYYLSLPTYGYRVYFDPDGQYQAISAETINPVLKPGYSMKTVMADEGALAKVVQSLKNDRPDYCKGILWFRLPVDEDQLNWSWDGLLAVMDGRVPTLAFEVEVRESNPQLVEIRIHHAGEQHTPKPIQIELQLPQEAILAYDIMNGYRGIDGVSILQGQAPRKNHTILAAWIRYKEGFTLKTHPIHLTRIEVLP